MPWGPRVAPTSVIDAEGDKIYVFAQYNDTSGNLTAFMPVCKDLSDSAEYNTALSTTAFTLTNSSTVDPIKAPKGIVQRTCGKVVLANNAFSGGVSTGAVPEVMGIYSPANPNDKPSIGDIIRVMKFGATPIQISAGFTANVGDYVLATSGTALAITTVRTGPQPSLGAYIGRVTGSVNQISVGQAATQPGFQFGFLINGFVNR